MKDKRDKLTEDWVDKDDERREREIQEHARRKARQEKLRERSNSEKVETDRKGPRSRS